MQLPAPPPAAPRVAPVLEQVTPLAHVEVRGNGPIPMILIPHWTFSWNVWDDFMTRHQDRYTMYAVTLPGFGGSDPPPLPVDAKPGDLLWLTNAMRAVNGLIDERKIEKPVLVGHGMGGVVALRVALVKGAAIRGVVSIDGRPNLPMGLPGQHVPRETRTYMINDFYRPKMEQIPDETWLEQQREQVLKMSRVTATASRLADESVRVPKTISITYLSEHLATDLAEDMTSLAAPSLFIATIPEEDTKQFPREAVRRDWREIVSAAPRSQIVFYEGARLFLFLDHPAEFDAAVRAFVEGKQAAGMTAGK